MKIDNTEIEKIFKSKSSTTNTFNYTVVSNSTVNILNMGYGKIKNCNNLSQTEQIEIQQTWNKTESNRNDIPQKLYDMFINSDKKQTIMTNQGEKIFNNLPDIVKYKYNISDNNWLKLNTSGVRDIEEKYIMKNILSILPDNAIRLLKKEVIYENCNNFLDKDGKPIELTAKMLCNANIDVGVDQKIKILGLFNTIKDNEEEISKDITKKIISDNPSIIEKNITKDNIQNIVQNIVQNTISVSDDAKQEINIINYGIFGTKGKDCNISQNISLEIIISNISNVLNTVEKNNQISSNNDNTPKDVTSKGIGIKKIDIIIISVLVLITIIILIFIL